MEVAQGSSSVETAQSEPPVTTVASRPNRSESTPATKLLEAIAGASARQEDITTYSLGATWAIQRNLTANAELRHDSRDSNVQFYQYRVRSLSMSLQYLF